MTKASDLISKSRMVTIEMEEADALVSRMFEMYHKAAPDDSPSEFAHIAVATVYDLEDRIGGSLMGRVFEILMLEMPGQEISLVIAEEFERDEMRPHLAEAFAGTGRDRQAVAACVCLGVKPTSAVKEALLRIAPGKTSPDEQVTEMVEAGQVLYDHSENSGVREDVCMTTRKFLKWAVGKYGAMPLEAIMVATLVSAEEVVPGTIKKTFDLLPGYADIGYAEPEAEPRKAKKNKEAKEVVASPWEKSCNRGRVGSE